MSYFRYRFTYGIKTTAQINALTGIREGESVWNSDCQKPEYVFRSPSATLHWVNEDCVLMYNNSGTTMSTGQVVRISTATGSPVTASCNIARSGEDDWMCGVVFRGGAANSYVVIAQQGKYKVLMVSGQTAVRGNLVTLSTTTGSANRTTAGSTGVFGVQLRTLTAIQVTALGGLVECMIQNYSSN
jgi:hypothetical protein